jgi:serine/threonine-protein kinase HipA
MTEQSIEEINVLQLTLNGHLVGYLAGFKNGRNVLTFADEFRNNPKESPAQFVGRRLMVLL